jgi:hypothetical protein
MTPLQKRCEALAALMRKGAKGKVLERLVDGAWEEVSVHNLPSPERFRVKPRETWKLKQAKGGEE